MNVRRIMSRNVATVKPNTPVKQVFELMKKNKFSVVSVIDDEGNLAGLIPESNLLLRIHEKHKGGEKIHLDPKEFVRTQKKIYGSTARDVMETDICAVDENMELIDLAGLMLETGLSRFPVVRGRTKLVGFITRNHLLSAFMDMEYDRDLNAEKITDEEIQNMVLRAMKSNMGLDFMHVKPVVRNGKVTLKGQVSDVRTQRQVEEIVKSLPGVKGVENNLLIDFLLG